MHASARQDAAEFAFTHLGQLPDDSLILDVGSQDINGTLRDLVPLRYRYVGLDIAPGRNVDLVEPIPYKWQSLADNSVDAIMCSQVFEHVQYPWELAKEMLRVLKPGGVCYVCTPHTAQKHKYPIDCSRFWDDGLRGVMEWAGFQVISCYEGPAHVEYGTTIGDTTCIARKP